MAPRRSPRKQTRPALTADGRENQLSSLAFDLSEKMLKEGSAPAQVITHFLKLASSREKLEQARIENENLLLSAKIERLASEQRQEALFEEALKAMRSYSGQDVEEYDDYAEG